MHQRQPFVCRAWNASDVFSLGGAMHPDLPRWKSVENTDWGKADLRPPKFQALSGILTPGVYGTDHTLPL